MKIGWSRIVISMSFGSLAFGVGGCEDLDKPNYITVTLSCDPYVEVFPATVEGATGANVMVKIEIIKAGGERVSDLVVTNAAGYGASVSGTFNVYREQPISCIGNVVSVSVEEEYPGYVFNSDEVTVLWSDIYPASDFGDRASFSHGLVIHGFKK